MPRTHDCDVLIVGAGPTGVTLGLLLARGGVETLVIDKEEDIYPLPRAAHVDHETMRTFQTLGVADDVMATSRQSSRYDFLTADGQVLLSFDGTDKVGPGGWPVSNMVHQPFLEVILRKAAKEQDQLHLRTGWNWTNFTSDEEGCVSAIATPDGEMHIRSRFLVGADGARSPVRTDAGIEMDDLGFDEEWLVIDTVVHDFERLPKINLQICDPDRPTTCVLMGSGRHRWEFMLKLGETAEQVQDDAFVAKLLEPWKVEDAVTLERKAVYRFTAKVAKVWRKGHVLLAGDAAHLTPPFAGQGLCAGLRDATNLAWKLQAVTGGADERLLDSYQSEREANARPIIQLAMMMGRTVCITDPEAARERDKQMLAARLAGKAPDGAVPMPPIGPGVLFANCPHAGNYFPQFVTGRGAMLDDILGPGAWLISRDPGGLPESRAGFRLVSADDSALAPLRAKIEDWLATCDADAVLVRPDRYIFGTGRPEALARDWTEMTA